MCQEGLRLACSSCRGKAGPDLGSLKTGRGGPDGHLNRHLPSVQRGGTIELTSGAERAGVEGKQGCPGWGRVLGKGAVSPPITGWPAPPPRLPPAQLWAPGLCPHPCLSWLRGADSRLQVARRDPRLSVSPRPSKEALWLLGTAGLRGQAAWVPALAGLLSGRAGVGRRGQGKAQGVW